jgi:hypothetical protein
VLPPNLIQFLTEFSGEQVRAQVPEFNRQAELLGL